MFARDAHTRAEKSAALVADLDGDGQAGAGDVLRYTVILHGVGGDQFADAPGPTGRLIPGTVATTHGTVTTGNGPRRHQVLSSRISPSTVATAPFLAVTSIQ